MSGKKKFWLIVGGIFLAYYAVTNKAGFGHLADLTIALIGKAFAAAATLLTTVLSGVHG